MRFNCIILLMLLLSTTLVAQSSGLFADIETECLGVELDGSETLRVWGVGRNKQDAVEQAKKNAVQHVLFVGVRKGNKGCNTKALLLEVNAEQKYQYYFNLFFKDGGEYLKYISMEDKRSFSNQKKKNKVQSMYGVTVRVLRSELRQRLIDDHILKP